MAVVTRFAAIKYNEGTTPETKREILEALLKLYDNEYLAESGFQGASGDVLAQHGVRDLIDLGALW